MTSEICFHLLLQRYPLYLSGSFSINVEGVTDGEENKDNI